MRADSTLLGESDIDPSVSEETCSTTVSSVTPDLDESVNFPKQRCTKRRPASHRGHTLIIFDYDDTILPTSYLSKCGYKLDGPSPVGEIKRALDEYSIFVQATLREAKKRGHVIIVTNAETGWIPLTVQKFIPLISAEIHELQHISARSIFEPAGVETPIAWKESAFRLVVEEYLQAKGTGASKQSANAMMNSPFQVISLGDSGHEREAVLKVCGEFKITSKSLKFMERPDLDSLLKQHQLIHECLGDIVRTKNNLDLCIQTCAERRSP
jgi:hypothetical protein